MFSEKHRVVRCSGNLPVLEKWTVEKTIALRLCKLNGLISVPGLQRGGISQRSYFGTARSGNVGTYLVFLSIPRWYPYISALHPNGPLTFPLHTPTVPLHFRVTPQRSPHMSASHPNGPLPCPLYTPTVLPFPPHSPNSPYISALYPQRSLRFRLIPSTVLTFSALYPNGPYIISSDWYDFTVGILPRAPFWQLIRPRVGIL